MHNPVLQTLENIIQYTNKRPDSKEAPGNQKNPDRWPEGLGSPRAGSTCRREREKIIEKYLQKLIYIAIFLPKNSIKTNKKALF